MPIDLHSADPENKDRERFLKRILGQLTSWQKKKQALASYFGETKMKAHLGTINSQIIRSNPRPQRDRLTKLPRELGGLVWEQLDEPGDRLMLALTCKYNAGMYEELKNVRGQPPMIKATKKTNLKPKNTKAAAKPGGVGKKTKNSALKGTKAETMTILRRLQSWMREEYDLCYICMQYKDKSASCEIKDFKERGGWGGRAFPQGETENGKKITLKKLETEGRRCPVCVIRKHTDCMAETSAAYRQIKAMLE